MDRQEGSLVDRAIAGDMGALEVLLVEHAPALRQRIERRSPPSLRSASEDLLQETLTLAFRSISTFQPVGPQSLQHWLNAIGDNVVRNAIRSRTAAKRGDGREAVPLQGDLSRTSACLLSVLALSQTSPSGDLKHQEVLDAVESALGELPESHREALMLRFVHSLPIVEVAKRLNRTESAINKVLARALERLRERVSDHNCVTRDFESEKGREVR